MRRNQGVSAGKKMKFLQFRSERTFGDKRPYHFAVGSTWLCCVSLEWRLYSARQKIISSAYKRIGNSTIVFGGSSLLTVILSELASRKISITPEFTQSLKHYSSCKRGNEIYAEIELE